MANYKKLLSSLYFEYFKDLKANPSPRRRVLSQKIGESAKVPEFLGAVEMISFKWKHFKQDIILMLVRWYLAYSLSYRDIEELALERGLKVDHSTC